MREEANSYKPLLAKATRLFGLALLAAFLLYFLINVVFACATFAAAGMRTAWARTAAIQAPRLSWERPRLELVHPFSYEYRGLNCLILATFVPVFLYLIQAQSPSTETGSCLLYKYKHFEANTYS